MFDNYAAVASCYADCQATKDKEYSKNVSD
jgi:hypothetical protein